MKRTHPNATHASCSIKAAQCLQFFPATGWDWGATFFCLLLSDVVIALWFTLAMFYLFYLFIYLYILHFNVRCKYILLMGIFPKYMAMFKIFAISANPRTWRSTPFVLGLSYRARWCGDLYVLFSSSCLPTWERILLCMKKTSASVPSLLLSACYC